MSLREHVSLREHACVSSRGAQSTELVWILDFKQILLLLLLLYNNIFVEIDNTRVCSVLSQYDTNTIIFVCVYMPNDTI